MMNRNLRLFGGLPALLIAGPLSAQQPAPQPQLRVSGIELSVGARVQTQFNTTSIDSEAPSELFIRRARIELGARLSEHVTGALQPDFAGDEVSLKDAYLKLELSPALQVLAGKAHRPFGLLEQTSSKRMLPIERGLRIRGLDAADEYAFVNGLDYSDRDIGVQVLGAPTWLPGSLEYAAGVFRGPLQGAVGNQDSYQFAARVTVSPMADLRIGAGWSNLDFAGGAEEAPELQRGNAFEVDLEYGAFAPGLHLLAELTRGDLDPFTDTRFWGAQGWLGYRTGALGDVLSAVEPILRVSHASTDGPLADPARSGGTLFTPGVNLYFGPLNRFMLNYDLWRGADGSPDASSFKAMFQFGL